ncbi:hypothetical protein BLA24064_04928 [Burkholderia latens]|uniref:Uncharacterized protein n=1 Tax=Burkholderia latens TaxID=488446 RepID=A0A6P2P8Q9_9BURK|nr:hypothetical protein BLA24064_04928 [Burkholderia latens]
MNRIAIPAIKSLAAESGARASHFVAGRTANTFAALRNFVETNFIALLGIAGVAASASLAEIALTIAITIITRTFRRPSGTLPAARA